MAKNIFRYQVRNDTAENWESKNPILAVGELGYDATNKIARIGDGVTPWDELAIIVTSKDLFGTMEWKEIAQISEAGQAQRYFQVGNTKTIKISNAEKVELTILGFNHDDLSDGSGKAGITIGMTGCFETSYAMNSSVTNKGGWEECQMRTETLPAIFETLPTDLQKVIKTVNKKATAGAASTSIVTSKDQLFLFARAEIADQTEAGYVDEGEKYMYWKIIKDGETDAARIKYKPNGSSANIWWLRSPLTSGSVSFGQVTASGSFGGGNANLSRGVCLGFCI